MATAKYHREWYHRNKERLKPIKRERSVRQRLFRRHFLDGFKLFMGCKICGYSEHPRALQFHHRDRFSKDFGISDARCRLGLLDILKEIDKCDVLCANCHAIFEDSIDREI